MLPAGSMCSGSTVFSGGLSVWWGPAMWCVTAVAVCAGTSVMWGAMAWRSMKWSRMASVEIIMAVTPVSGVMWARTWLAESVSVSMVMVRMSGVAVPRCWPVTSTRGVISVPCWHAWRRYFVRAICCNMSIIVAIKMSNVWTIACHVASFLALKTLVIVTRHGVDWRWW